ncbi:MAG: hypothetical protein HY721_22330 [Planctomycetes bacterium]|nr:hypothetical protein [Planctomycetota bacterium]
MQNCPNCSATLERKGASFCSQCGSRLPDLDATGSAPVGEDQGQALGGRSVGVQGLAAGTPGDQDPGVDRLGEVSLPSGLVMATPVLTAGNPAEGPGAGRSRFATSWTPGAVEVLINDNHFYMEGKAGVLDFMIVNRLGEAASGLRLEVHCDMLGAISHSGVFPLDLEPGETHRERFPVKPLEPGEHLINLVLTYEAEGHSRACRAQQTIRVLAETATPESVIVNIDRSIHAASGAKIGFGMSMREAVHEGLAKGLITSVNDLLTQAFPDQWKPVQLRQHKALEKELKEAASRRVKVVAHPPQWRARASRARLAVVSAAGRCESSLLLGLSEVRLGRARERCDIALRVLPRSEANDQKTLQITGARPHCSIGLRAEGLFVVDHDSVNGTELQGARLRRERMLPLDRPSELAVAGVLRLRLVPFVERKDLEAFQASDHSLLGEPDDLWRLADRLAVRSLVLERVDDAVREERYVLVYRFACIGSGPDCEIPWPSRTGQGAAARIARLGGQFWLESRPGSTEPEVEGVVVPSGWACPLRCGNRIVLGGFEGQFTEFQQLGL